MITNQNVLLTPVLSFHYPIPDANGPLKFSDDLFGRYQCDFFQLSMPHTLVDGHPSLDLAEGNSFYPVECTRPQMEQSVPHYINISVETYALCYEQNLPSRTECSTVPQKELTPLIKTDF